MEISRVAIRSILTRTSGYLATVCSHSLQPYRGCPLGSTLCGVGCYVRHQKHLLAGREWGTFLDVRENTADAYLAAYERETRWSRRSRGGMRIFLSSVTEPFPAQERRFGITRSVLVAMLDRPPDGLIIQTHSPFVTEVAGVLMDLSSRCELRVHVSIETDREEIPGLPRPASTVESRFRACAALRASGLRVVVTASPLLPIADPDRFFGRVGEVADAVVLDHFIGGDGSATGHRTRTTGLPGAMAAIDPGSIELAYRDRMGEVAERYLPGRVGYSIDGFAGRFGRGD